MTEEREKEHWFVLVEEDEEEPGVMPGREQCCGVPVLPNRGLLHQHPHTHPSHSHG